MITVLGKLSDTLKYLGESGYNVLPPSPDWTPGANRQWLQSAIERGDAFLIFSHDISGQFAEELWYLIRNHLSNLDWEVKMSVRTTADEKRDAAKDHVDAAIKNLSEIVIDQVYGSNEFSQEYNKRLFLAMSTLIEIRASI
jgi:hypothetical protein